MYLFRTAIAGNGHRAMVIAILLGLAPFAVGCSKGKSVERFPIHGTVKLANGEKFDGSITFLPDKGPAANIKVAEGRYKFDPSNGPVAGPQTVIVKRMVPMPRVPKFSGQPAKQEANSEWTLRTEVSDDGQYLRDFTLED